MKNKNNDLFKKYIKDYSTKEQKPFAGLAQDLKHLYKTKSATGNEILDMLHQLSTGAESDDLDGLKTRLMRLDKMREYLLKSELTGQEQKTVYTAYTKVQTAIRKRKDEYQKKHNLLKNIVSDVGNNLYDGLYQVSAELPQLRVALALGNIVFGHVKKYNQQRKQKLNERQDQLRRDAEMYYSRELLRGTNQPSGKNKSKKIKGKGIGPIGPIQSGIENYQGQVVHDNLAENYNMGRQGPLVRTNKKDDKLVILKGIAGDVKIIANYYRGKLIRDKDQKLDDLEALREKQKLKAAALGGLVKDKNAANEGGSGAPSFWDAAMGGLFGAKGIPAIWRGLKWGTKGTWGFLKNLPEMLKRAPGLIKSLPLLALGLPALMKNMGGKSLDWVKSLPSKGMEKLSGLWKGADAAGDVAKGVSSAGTKVAEKVAVKEGVEAGAKMGAAAIGKKIPVAGALVGLGLGAWRALQGDFTGAGLEVASGVAGALGPVTGGLGTAASFAIDAGLIARDLGAFGGKSPMTEASATEDIKRELPNNVKATTSPEEQRKLIKETMQDEIRKDPSSMPAAIVPVAKLQRTGDLKDILESAGSEGYGFLFSLKNTKVGELLGLADTQRQTPNNQSFGGGTIPRTKGGGGNQSSGSQSGQSSGSLVRGSSTSYTDDGYLNALIGAESAGDPNAKARTSSAGGLGQIIDKTWRDATKQMGVDWPVSDKYDPEKNLAVTKFLTEQNRKILSKAIGRNPSDADLYMAHFLGPTNAAKFIKAMQANPNANAAQMFPKAAAANPTIFRKHRSLTDVYNIMSNKINKRPAEPKQQKLKKQPASKKKETAPAAPAGTPTPVPPANNDSDWISSETGKPVPSTGSDSRPMMDIKVDKGLTPIPNQNRETVKKRSADVEKRKLPPATPTPPPVIVTPVPTPVPAAGAGNRESTTPQGAAPVGMPSFERANNESR